MQYLPYAAPTGTLPLQNHGPFPVQMSLVHIGQCSWQITIPKREDEVQFSSVSEGKSQSLLSISGG